MEMTDFSRRIEDYAEWKSNLILEIEKYKHWLDTQGHESPETDLRIYELLETLKSDRVTIAFVAEFSRGKTELINAIFFAAYKRRLLPSEAGRTTMCPTELFYDDKNEEPYLRLLPIETRAEEISIAEYKLDPMAWQKHTLNTDYPDEMAEVFKEIIQTKKVPIEEALRLGLYDEENHESVGGGDEVEIPVWRHALISFPHPLLKQGLVVLDTPGLNALGNEPELTVNMLPNAQAVLFVLAADTGVTKSDMDMWKNYIRSFRNVHEKGLMVVMNKIDTLWDELTGESVVEQTINKQSSEAAKLLGISTDSIFPLSAQKGLIAKVKHDQALLEKSRLIELETSLAENVIPHKQEIVRENVINDIGAMVQDSRGIIVSRLCSADAQKKELESLSGKNIDMIQHLMKTTREEQVVYQKNLQSFQASHTSLKKKTQGLLASLNVSAIDKMITQARTDMADSWTTHGLKVGMKSLFNGARDNMDNAKMQADKIRDEVLSIYKKFHEQHGMMAIKPKMFSITQYKLELDKLYQEAEDFRKSPAMAVTEKYFVIKKFFISIASHARNTFYNAQKDADNWAKIVMNPLVLQIREHKDAMDNRLARLRKISESHETLDVKIKELESDIAELNTQLATIEGILGAIDYPLEPELQIAAIA
ncbi:MAG: dynamin family protein [Gammaproteobacteria bacterium]|nr:dynamin family protein [Gammaproteobacteria bacterium]